MSLRLSVQRLEMFTRYEKIKLLRWSDYNL